MNVIQLEKLSANQNELLLASIAQKSSEISNIAFCGAIDIKANRKFLKFAYVPAILIALLLVLIPSFIIESSTRIVRYNTDFIPEAPFQFIIQADGLTGFKNEAHTILVNVEGETKPANPNIVINNRKIKLNKSKEADYSYTIGRLKNNQSFYIEAEGISSKEYVIETYERPNISLFKIQIESPEYTNLENESIENTGNITLAEGSKVTWNFNTQSTNSVILLFKKSLEKLTASEKRENVWEASSVIKESDGYSINLENEFSNNRDSLIFNINVIKDQYPQIILEQVQDTILFRKIVFAGNIVDDYGFSNLEIHSSYDGGKSYERTGVDINHNLSEQSYYEVLSLNEKAIIAGAEVKYFMQVTDNDGVNGPKTSKTGTYTLKIPSLDELQAEIDANTNQVKLSINQTLKEAQELNKKIQEADEKLKSKKELEWQDEKLMEEILEQKEKLANKLEELQKENTINNKKQQQFSPQSQELQEKIKQLQEIMENVLDEETRKLYEELRELLNQEADIEEFRNQMEEMKRDSKNLEEDLERTLELFKTLQFDAKLQENIDQLEKEIEDQKLLQKETEQGEKSNEELAQKQQEEIKDLEKLQEETRKT